ncbi:hypothetical protein F2Q69_00042219 [Brassica cretica]|uniref:Uncharacterized protein n=1 Tax=Brassica cretica TaxID=69181 RepID=A0A8S9NKK8_BRACR|nr:hypothetical protein F2Q69_00042219 [Brassica cretica]
MVTRACSVSVAIWRPGLVTSQSPYGDPALQHPGCHMATWAGKVMFAIWRLALQHRGRHMASWAQAVLLESEDFFIFRRYLFQTFPEFIPEKFPKSINPRCRFQDCR